MKTLLGLAWHELSKAEQADIIACYPTMPRDLFPKFRWALKATRRPNETIWVCYDYDVLKDAF